MTDTYLYLRKHQHVLCTIIEPNLNMLVPQGLWKYDITLLGFIHFVSIFDISVLYGYTSLDSFLYLCLFTNKFIHKIA